MAKGPSPTQLKAVRLAEPNGGLRRLRGGYWVPLDAPPRSEQETYDSGEWVGTATVAACCRLGLMRWEGAKRVALVYHAPAPPPTAFAGVKEGDWLTVKRGYLGRSGQQGQVCDRPDTKGVSLDFFTCGQCGAKNCQCYTSIEFWEWSELEPPHGGTMDT